MSTWKELKDNPRLREMYETRAQIVRLIREFFWAQEFMETDTPIAVRFPGQEPYLHPMSVEMHNPQGVAHQFFLHTSPEYAMKKLLAAGFPKIFQITHCFRNQEDSGGTHNPEFTMIEWYRSPGNYHEIMDDTEALFQYVAKKLGVSTVVWNNVEVSILEPWERLTMCEVWQRYVGVDLNEYLTPSTLAELVRARGFTVGINDTYEDLFFKIFLNEIEPKLGCERPIFITEYPSSMAALARACPNDARYAERFELYVAGLEIANAFGELTNAIEQEERFVAEQKLRAQLGYPVFPLDRDFLGALTSGFSVAEGHTIPSAGGIALGVDRMVGLFTRAQDIGEVIFQTVADQLDS